MVKVEMKEAKEKKKILPLVLVIANRILNELGFTEIINKSVKWDEDRSKQSPGSLLKTLVLSTFFDVRAPLTQIENRFSGIDLGYLLGEDIEVSDINESNIGRALDKLGNSDYNSLYETMALTAVQLNNIPVTRLHADTTTISFYGEYEDSGESALPLTDKEYQELLKIERGYNKDGRHQCNQVVVGQIVNETGIPVISRTMNGATSDIEWNKEAVKYMKSLMTKGFTKGIFVADSKLITNDLVKQMLTTDSSINFVSRCPANFEGKLESRMIKKAYEADEWHEIGKFHVRKEASYYRGKSFTENVCGFPMRLLVLQSSSLSGKAETALQNEEEKLRPLIREAEKKTFACYADAKKEEERIKSMKQLRLFNCKIEISKDTKETWPRGRRTEKSQPKITESYSLQIDRITRNEEACRTFMQTESCIVLISNVMEKEADDRTLLQIYKGQQVVENSFRMLKEPQVASVIYLKNPVRIQALSILLTLSLLVRAIIQYKMRDGLKTARDASPNIAYKAGWKNRNLEAPTFKLFYEHSINCNFIKESTDEYSFTWINDETAYKVSTLLMFMGLTVEILLE